jgi:SAM-dependent methyltransferase
MISSTFIRMQWFIDHFVPSNITQSVLDVGSQDLNRSFRGIFSHSRLQYTGADVEHGPNVDIVLDYPYRWEKIQRDSFDIVIYGNVIEHVEFPWRTFSEMTRFLKPGGLLCIIVPNGFREHRYPVDCWRFFTDGVIALARWTNLGILYAHTNDCPNAIDLNWFSFRGRAAETMLVARKPYSGPPQHVNFSRHKISAPDQSTYLGGFVSYDALSIWRQTLLLFVTYLLR